MSTTTSTMISVSRGRSRARSWPVLLLAAPAFVAIWSGWVGLGSLTGFGEVHPLPGTPWDGFTLDTAITLPVGVETYAAYALHVWLSRTAPAPAATFAKYSAIGSLILGAAGQVTYHLMIAAHMVKAPWPITALVACLPVAVLGMGAALAHLVADTSVVDETSAEPEESDDSDEPETTSERDKEEQDKNDRDTRDETEHPKARHTRRASGPTPVAVKVLRLRERHPDLTVRAIAAKAGCSVRTASRHLNATPTTDTRRTAAALAGRPDSSGPASADAAA